MACSMGGMCRHLHWYRCLLRTSQIAVFMNACLICALASALKRSVHSTAIQFWKFSLNALLLCSSSQSWQVRGALPFLTCSGIYITVLIKQDFCAVFILNMNTFPFIVAPRVTQLGGNSCEVTWEMVPPMKGDPVGYVLQVLVGRESEYKQVGKWSGFNIVKLMA